MAKTLSWSMLPQEKDAIEGASKSKSKPSEPSDEAVDRRKATVDDMRALVGEVESVEERVRSRSRRMRAPSVSPDEALSTDSLGEPILPPTLPPARGRAVPSTQPPPPDSQDRDPDGGRYSFVSPPKRKKK